MTLPAKRRKPLPADAAVIVIGEDEEFVWVVPKDPPSDLLTFSKVSVRPHLRRTEHGIVPVVGHRRTVEGASIVYGNEVRSDDPVIEHILPNVRVDERSTKEAEVRPFAGKYRIVVGPKFFGLSPEHQRSVLQHEYMHFLRVDDRIVKEVDWDELLKAGKYSYAGDSVIEVAADLAKLVYTGEDDDFAREFPDLRKKVAAAVKDMVPDADVRPQEKTPKPKPHRFDIPTTAQEAAEREAEILIESLREKLVRLEALSDDEYRSWERAENPITPSSVADLKHDPMRTALWRERHDWSNSFKRTFPHDYRQLALARGDRRYRGALVRRLRERRWAPAKPERTNPEQRALIARQAAEAFTEPKMAAVAAEFGLPSVYVAHDMLGWDVSDEELEQTPVAQYLRNGQVVFYESTDLIDTEDERLESSLFTSNDTEGKPGMAVSSQAQGKPVKAVMRHEYGHMVGDVLGSANVPDGFSSLWAAAQKEFQREWYAVNDSDLPESEKYTARSALSKRQFSYYGFENSAEGWAEAFAIVMHPDFKRSEWDGIIGETLLDFAIQKLAERGVKVG